MIPTESTYQFSFACLNHLARELAAPNFIATDAQKVVLDQALRLLDLELSFQAAEHSDLVENINQWFNSDFDHGQTVPV